MIYSEEAALPWFFSSTLNAVRWTGQNSTLKTFLRLYSSTAAIVLKLYSYDPHNRTVLVNFFDR